MWTRKKQIKTKARMAGYAKMKRTTAQRMALECTLEIHKEKAKTLAYCNVCKRSIYSTL